MGIAAPASASSDYNGIDLNAKEYASCVPKAGGLFINPLANNRKGRIVGATHKGYTSASQRCAYLANNGRLVIIS